MKVISSIFVAFVMVLMLSVSANAQLEIFGIGNFNGRVIPCDPVCGPCEGMCLPCCEDTFETDLIGFFGESSLYKISPITGQPNFIGFTGFGDCNGLDINPLTGDLYGVCNRLLIHEGPPGEVLLEEEIEGQVLVKINPNTGEGTEIGPLGDGIGSFIKGAGFISDISFDSTGVLYAHLNGFNPIYMVPFPLNPEEKTSNGIIENTLGTIDLLTGAFQPIGPTESQDDFSAIGFSTIGELIQCANFNNLRKGRIDEDINELLVPSFTNINRLNQNTGFATFIRQAVFPPDVDGHFNTITSKDVDDNTGVFYGFLRTEFDNWIFDAETNNILDGSYLIRINPLTGQVEIIGLTSPFFEDFEAIAVRNVSRNVPTMSEYGLMATAVLLLVAAAIFLRRRQAKLEA